MTAAVEAETATTATVAAHARSAAGWMALHNRHTDERLWLRRIERDGRVCLQLRGTLPQHRQGPPRHVHYTQDEEGRVVSGTLTAEVGGTVVTAAAGETVRLPKGVPHRWWNDGDQPLEFEGLVIPADDLDVYLSGAFEVLNSGPADRPSLFYMAHLSWRHRRSQAVLFAPRWLQAVLVPAVVLVGTLLGRYRGTRWPGHPARCTAAPTGA